jgi:hypothetical protein
VKLEDLFEDECEEDLVTVGVRESLALFEGHLNERIHEDCDAIELLYLFLDLGCPHVFLCVVRLDGRWRLCVIETAVRRVGANISTVHRLGDASAFALAELSDRMNDLYLTLEKEFPREPKESSVDKSA